MLGFPADFGSRDAVSDSAVENALEWLRTSRPARQNHWPALALALTAQSWRDYRPLIRAIGTMTPQERRAFADGVWAAGVLEQGERHLAAVKQRSIRPFERVLSQMPTQVPRVRGGALLQGLASGYLRADSPNLVLESHKVSTGASRAGMLGDADGFRGREPGLAAEVKDAHITEENHEDLLGDFLEDIVTAPNATALVICSAIDRAARDAIESRNVTVLTKADMADRVAVWDLPKQQEALRGVEYFLGRIQRDDHAVDYLRTWLDGEGIDAGLGPQPLPATSGTDSTATPTE